MMISVMGKYKVLISSNVTARGIDIQSVSTVLNFDMPKDIHTYLHRIGRSGRWGKKGVAINFVTRRDFRKMRKLRDIMILLFLNFLSHLLICQIKALN